MVCNEESENKSILDCGAGGDCPPLSLFKYHGYETTGIELDEKQAQLAWEYGKSQNQILGIQLGDMRALPFQDEGFGIVYSYNSIFHKKLIGILGKGNSPTHFLTIFDRQS